MEHGKIVPITCSVSTVYHRLKCNQIGPQIQRTSWNSRKFRFSSVQFSRLVVSNSLHESQHARPPCPSIKLLPEFTQTHVHLVSDAIQPSHPLSSPFAATSEVLCSSGLSQPGWSHRYHLLWSSSLPNFTWVVRWTEEPLLIYGCFIGYRLKIRDSEASIPHCHDVDLINTLYSLISLPQLKYNLYGSMNVCLFCSLFNKQIWA